MPPQQSHPLLHPYQPCALLQDILGPQEIVLPLAGKDHFELGTGAIPTEDWELLASVLDEIDFKGIAVFEIRPRRPLQTALRAHTFFESLLGNAPGA